MGVKSRKRRYSESLPVAAAPAAVAPTPAPAPSSCVNNDKRRRACISFIDFETLDTIDVNDDTRLQIVEIRFRGAPRRFYRVAAIWVWVQRQLFRNKDAATAPEDRRPFSKSQIAHIEARYDMLPRHLKPYTSTLSLFTQLVRERNEHVRLEHDAIVREFRRRHDEEVALAASAATTASAAAAAAANRSVQQEADAEQVSASSLFQLLFYAIRFFKNRFNNTSQSENR